MDSNIDISKVIGPFLTWQFGAACIAILAIMTCLKKALVKGAPNLLEKGWFSGFIMTPMNLVLGVLCAIPKGFLPGERYSLRAFVGICAGFLCQFMYHMILKRVFGAKDKNNDGIPDDESGPVSSGSVKSNKPI